MVSIGTALTECPVCDEPLLIPITARAVDPTTYKLAFDFGQVRDHAATHEASYTLELPPTAR